MKCIWKLATVLFLTLAMFAGGAAIGEAATKYVKADGTGDGSTWALASKDLAGILKNAADGTEVWVAAGTYSPGSTAASTFNLKKGVKLVGGYPAAGNDTRDWVKNPTTLNGNNVNYHVVTGGGIEPSKPTLPVGTSTDVVAVMPEYTPNLASVDEKIGHGVFTSRDVVVSDDGVIILSRDLVKAAGIGGGLSFDKYVDIPIFTAASTDAGASGKIFAVGFKLKGVDFFAEGKTADNVKVQKISSPKMSYPYKYVARSNDFADKTFTVLTSADSGTIFRDNIVSTETYQLVVFILDSGDFDLGVLSKEVTDPTVILDNPTSTRRGGGGGCSAFSPIAFALLLAVPLIFRKR